MELKYIVAFIFINIFIILSIILSIILAKIGYFKKPTIEEAEKNTEQRFYLLKIALPSLVLIFVLVYLFASIFTIIIGLILFAVIVIGSAIKISKE